MRTTSRPRLHLTDRGTGPPVLLVTGWTISSAVFDPIAHLYEPHVRVITYDHRGTGRSAPWPAPVSAAMLAADAARVLDDRGVEAAHVVGVSMGAVVALETALRFPGRVRSLTLIGGGPGGPRTALPPVPDAARALTAVARDSVRHRRVWPAAAVFSADFRATADPGELAALTEPFGRHRAPPWAAGWQTLAMACYGAGPRLHRVRAPTLVLHGADDVMSPPANAERLAAGIPGARLVVCPGVGHAVPLERPRESARLLLDWVAEHAAAPVPPTTRTGRAAERATRPFALHTGTLRNTADAVLAVARVARR